MGLIEWRPTRKEEEKTEQLNIIQSNMSASHNSHEEHRLLGVSQRNNATIVQSKDNKSSCAIIMHYAILSLLLERRFLWIKNIYNKTFGDCHGNTIWRKS